MQTKITRWESRRGQGATNRWVNLRVFVLFVGLTAIATYPQARVFRTHVADHPDPYFSMWRLAWLAHQIVADPRHLFESPIFRPERNTFAYSDAMIVPALVLAPLRWMRVSLVTTYNTALFAAFALSGFTMFVLARYLTGNAAAAIVAGAVFA